MKRILSILFGLALVLAFSLVATTPMAAQEEPEPILELVLSGTARVADYDDGIYVVGTTAGELYVINELGGYAASQLGAGSINDVRIEFPFIAVAAGNTIIKLSLVGLAPEESWRITLPGSWSNRAVSTDLSGDGNYVAYLSRYDSMGIISDGSIVASYSISGSWIAHWLDATDDMEYIAITAEVGPYYSGVNSGVELYRFDGTSLNRMWGRILVYNYETTEVRVSEAKDYVAVGTSSGTLMNLLHLPTSDLVWQYDASPQEQFACDGDDNLEFVIGGTQAWSAPYRWFVLRNLGTSYDLLAEGAMAGAINDVDSTRNGLHFAFGSDFGEVVLLERTGDTIHPIFEISGLPLIDAIEIGGYTLLVGGENFINLYSLLIFGSPLSVSTATGTGTASFTPSAGNITGLSAVTEGSLPTAGKPKLSFPHGFFSFTITGPPTPLGTVTVTITLPPGPTPTQYWKYGPTPANHVDHWYQIPMTVVGPNVITITLVDGGLGDDDLTQNGVIVDQGAPAIGSVGWETYPVNKVRVFLPWIALLAAIALAASLLVLRHRRTTT
jgi:hypothetical protein